MSSLLVGRSIRQSAVAFSSRSTRTTFVPTRASLVNKSFQLPTLSHTRYFADDVAKAETTTAPQETAAPAAEKKPQAPVSTRIKSFTWGFLLATGVSFWILVAEGQRTIESMKETAQKTLEYQKNIEARLDKLETEAAGN